VHEIPLSRSFAVMMMVVGQGPTAIITINSLSYLLREKA
jgi:hypothetical protein